jgi:hypothetical protein
VPQTAWRKSSFSNDEGSSCVEVAWRKSSRSHDVGSDCVEVGWPSRRHPSMNDPVLVRDSKNSTGPMLTVPTDAWHQLLTSKLAGWR